MQARELAARLARENITKMFCSPFLRAVHTAHYAAEALDLSPCIEPGLCEWLNPEWFAADPLLHDLAELRRRFPRIDPNYRPILRPKLPETVETLASRTRLTVEAITQEYEGEVLLVGHGVSVIGVAQELLGEQVNVNWELCSLTKLVWEGQWRLELNGDTSHLSGAGDPVG